MRLFGHTKEEIIEIVGKAFQDEYNGNVGVYDALGKIVLWDKIGKKEYLELLDRIFALYDYLNLEYIESGKPTVKKRRSK